MMKMVSDFIDRYRELEYLEKLYHERKPQLIVIYGRRRIGKTELVKKFLEGKSGLYFFALKQPLKLELQRLSESLSRLLGEYVKPDFFQIFEKIASLDRFVFVIDEFTYWVEEDPRVLSLFQRAWDDYLSSSSVYLILVASAFTLVEKSFSYGSALYGRRTGQWKLGPLEPRFLREFLPNYSLEDLVYVYGVAGGIPYYLTLFNDRKSFEENVGELFFNKGGVLYEEAENLLRFEVRDPYTYFNIVRAIEEGATSYSEIANKSKVGVTNLPKYLHILEKLNILKREKPIMGKSRPIYRIIDNYIRFWVRYVYPNKDKVELGTYRFDRETMRNYIPHIFEDMVRDSLPYLYEKKIIPFIGKCGRYWSKKEEIDIVCIEKEKLLAIEVKWKKLNAEEANKIIEETKRKLGHREGHYGVAAKEIEGKINGIKIELKDLFQ
ncbi:MAG: ATP-binding protein [Candidatus Njordarchaeia archaeon]